MRSQTPAYHVADLTPGRRVLINMLNLAGEKRSMVGLLEVDVTVPRQMIARFKEINGKSISFTGFLAFCLGHAIKEHPEVHAYLKGNHHLVIFDDVDVGVMVEHKDGEKRALMGHVLKAVNRRTLEEINAEIRFVQSAPLPPNRGIPDWFRTAMLLPGPLYKLFRVLIRWTARRDPTLVTSMGGTVSITSVGMFGEGHSGWGIYPANEVIGLVVGSIAQKPGVVEGRLEPRQVLHLTVLLDHEVIDGAPAARFVRRLVELIESGYGLSDLTSP
jgi:pyruvate/2-oxoglutarate dehydrogenase complex dihydrolipoamide acyltransferase (E2) component